MKKKKDEFFDAGMSALDAAYTMPIHAAISKVTAKHGLPDFTTYDDMYRYVLGELTAIQTLSQEGYAEFFADFLLEVEQMLDERFYGAKLNATLYRTDAHHETTMALTSAQLKLYEEFEYLVKATVYRCVSTGHLDPMIDKDDLEQAGYIALNRAVRAHIDGRNFRSYAIMHIRRAVMNTIAASETSKRSALVSLDTLLDEEDMSESVAQLPHALVSSDMEDAFDRKELMNILLREANRHKGCVRKGILVLIEVHIHGKTWTELAKELDLAPGLLSAWAAKAKRILFKSDVLRDFLGKPKYNPETDVYPRSKRKASGDS